MIRLPLVSQEKPWIIAMLIGLLPILVVSVCASFSMRHNLIETCFPLLDGCSSISAACRSVPVIYLFRAVMIPCSALLIGFWLLNHAWLAQYADISTKFNKLILTIGTVGAVFLVLYVIFLGTSGEVYRFLRRFGVYVFFAGTAIAQLLTVIVRRRSLASTIDRLQYFLVIAMLVLGPLNLILKAILENPKQMENTIEWNFGLLLCLFFILSAAEWFRVRFRPY